MADEVIRAGDFVLCDHYSTGFDDLVFTDPERFDVGRRRNPAPGVQLRHVALHRRAVRAGRAARRVRRFAAADAGLAPGRPVHRDPMLGTELGDQVGGSIARLPMTW
ncbi:hypothetical protein [Amycolatopsis sp. NPDC051372]|uniref:hypothetical protein n=1 Tax=Amycolatopsis sp. NPDC051372 TaxID=3155669 RepID=UPI003420C47D